MTAELARVGGMVAAAGLAALAVAPTRWARLAAVATVALGTLALAVDVAPSGHGTRLVVAGAAGVVVAAALGALFVRWPWLVPVAGLACAPVRIPVDLGETEANLLLPLYVVIAGAGAAFVFALVRGDARVRELGPLSWPFAAFVAWSGASLLWTEDLREGEIQLLAFYLPFGVLALVVARLEWSRRWLAFLGAQLVVMALAFAAIGLYQWIARDIFWNPKVIVPNAYAPFFRVNSVFWDPSIYGRFLVVAILTALVLVLYGAQRRVGIAAGLAIAGMWIGLLFSFSQSSFVALVSGVVAAAALAWRWRALAAIGAASALLLVVGFAAPQVRSAAGLNKATSGRSELVTRGARIAADHPVAGVGVGSFKREYARRAGLRGRDPKRAASHNTPVTVAAETGLLGFALFAWLVVTALVLPFRRASKSFSGRASLSFGLALLAIFVHSLFYNAFFEDPFTWALLGFVALSYAWRTSTRASRARSAGK